MKKIFFTLSLLVFIVYSCSSTKEDVRREVREATQTSNRLELREKMRTILEDSSKLGAEQKTEFLKLHDETILQVEQIEEKTRKVKMVLIEHLAEQEYNEPKVVVIRNELKKLHDKKFDVMMGALKKSKEILGVEFRRIEIPLEFRYNIR